ncbi:TIGR00296 family protein [Candidatus Woesearchaeota archaeon]|nr:TIGR00296 family protein [Candidatus Woesearchaeota archaeon]
MLSLEQGTKLVKLARQAISSYVFKKNLKIKDGTKKEFSLLSGAFVTLEKNNVLRGCIGITEAAYPLYRAVADSAVSASSDPRFPPLGREELEQITISVSVLTNPSVMNVRNADDYLRQIQIGKDGLLVRGVFNSGLLLPIVAIEQKWDALMFLQQTCMKAGLPADTWKDFDACRVYKFQTEVFSEKSPDGEVVKEM